MPSLSATSFSNCYFPVRRSPLLKNVAQNYVGENPGATTTLTCCSFCFNGGCCFLRCFFFYRKQLALQLPIADGVDWKEVLNRLHEGSMDKVQLDQIKHEVRNVDGSFVHLQSKNVRIDDGLTFVIKKRNWIF